MKKEYIIHFVFVVAYIAMASFLRNWLAFAYWPVWIGAIFGTVLPDVDNLVYTFFLKPDTRLTQLKSLPYKQKFQEILKIMYTKRQESPDLVFHTAQFQLVFLVFVFLLVTSSGSLFGIGLVLAFMLHLVIDQVTDYMEHGNIDYWFKDFPIVIDGKKRVWYLGANILAVITFGFFL